jgi:hypothetical protein
LNNIVLSIALLLAFVTGFFIAIKSVQLGLKWQIQTAEKKEPELKTPITEIKEAVQQNKETKVQQYTAEQIQEYLYGASGGK